MIPAGFFKLLPILLAEATLAPQIEPSIFAAQIQKESNWNVNARLKTAREDGRGLGQFTTAYRADGSVRFDAAAELRAKYRKELADFRGEGLVDPRLSIRALVLKNRDNYQLTQGAETHIDRVAFMLCAYNAGFGLCSKDRLLCANTPQCKSGRWFGHVEKQGYQSRVKWQGYGQSAFDITRVYVKTVLTKRHEYVPYTGT